MATISCGSLHTRSGFTGVTTTRCAPRALARGAVRGDAVQDRLLAAVQEADRLELDLVGIQDHPYQRRYLDTIALLSWLAARTDPDAPAHQGITMFTVPTTAPGFKIVPYINAQLGNEQDTMQQIARGRIDVGGFSVTAAALLAHFGSLDALLERIEEVPFLRLRGAASVAARLRAHREQALLCRQLTTIMRDAPLDHGRGFARGDADGGVLLALCDALRFGPLTRRRLHESAGLEFVPA